MSQAHRPRFRIHRLDSPEEPAYRAFWVVEGRAFRVRIWDDETWRQMPESAHPPDARRLSGPGWMLLRPLQQCRARLHARRVRRRRAWSEDALASTVF